MGLVDDHGTARRNGLLHNGSAGLPMIRWWLRINWGIWLVQPSTRTRSERCSVCSASLARSSASRPTVIVKCVSGISSRRSMVLHAFFLPVLMIYNKRRASPDTGVFSSTFGASVNRGLTGKPSALICAAGMPASCNTLAVASFGTQYTSLGARYQVELMLIESVTIVMNRKGR